MSASSDLASVIRYLLVTMPEKIKQEVRYGAEAVQAKTINDARSFCPTGVTGTLALSIIPGDITIFQDGSVEAKVEANADYASFVEFGTKPHFPPIEALEDWCAKFLGDAKLAFVVARAISRRGTYAHPFMGPALLENMPVFFQAMKAAVNRAIAA